MKKIIQLILFTLLFFNPVLLTASESDSSSSSEIIKTFNDIKVKYLQSQQKETMTDSNKVAKSQVITAFFAFLTFLLPISVLIGILLLGWGIKVLFVDDPRQHKGGAFGLIVSGGVKVGMGIAFISAIKLIGWLKENLLSGISDGSITNQMLIDMLISIAFSVIWILGILAFGIGIYKLTKKGHDKSSEIIRGILMIMGGLLMISLKSIYLFLK